MVLEGWRFLLSKLFPVDCLCFMMVHQSFLVRHKNRRRDRDKAKDIQKRDRQNDKQFEKQKQTKNREKETDRQTDRQTENERENIFSNWITFAPFFIISLYFESFFKRTSNPFLTLKFLTNNFVCAPVKFIIFSHLNWLFVKVASKLSKNLVTK